MQITSSDWINNSYLQLGIQTNKGLVEQESHRLAIVWAPKKAKSYTIFHRVDTNYSGVPQQEETGYATVMIKYYTTIKEGEHRVIRTHNKATFFVDSDQPTIEGYTDGSRWWGGVYVDAKVTRVAFVEWLLKSHSDFTVDEKDPDVLHVTTGGIHDIDIFKPKVHPTVDGDRLLYNLTDWRLVFKGEEATEEIESKSAQGE